MGAPRYRPLAAVVVMLFMVSGLAPLMMVTAAPDMFADTVYKGALDSTGPRDDYNFTAPGNQWTLLGVNNYQGTGAFRHGLRTDITSKNPIIYATVGSLKDTRSAGVVAINGYDIGASTDFTISEELAQYSPSYALQMRTDMVVLSRVSQTRTDQLEDDGVVAGYQINLQKRDTLDLRLRVPPEWTYNYHFTLLLFSPVGRYQQFEGQGGTQPVAVSDAGENSEQALTYLVSEPGTYLIVVLNMGVPDRVKYELDIGLNGKQLLDGNLDEETLTKVNLEDYYRFDAPTGSWSAAVVKARGEVDREFTHSLHWPTADSNTIAKDVLTDDSPVGILAINGRGLGAGSTTYYVREMYERGGTVVPFTVQFAHPTGTLPTTNGTVPGTLSASDIFRLWEIDLQASQTVDFRLRVDDYNYDHDLGLYVFAPGDKYYSISGELPEFASEPIAWSRAGLNTEQNTVFTGTATGTYAVVVVNFAARDDIPFTLDVTIQGRSLADGLPVRGDLNDFNREDLFQFLARPNEWNLVGSRLTSEDGALWHRLHSTALDTNPLREEAVGWHQAPGGKRGELAEVPVGLLAVDGHRLTSGTTYFVREEVEDGSPRYVVELENSPTSLDAAFDNLTFTFGASEFLHAYTVDLALRDTIDLRVAPPREWTYPYDLGIFVLSPGALYRNLGTEGDVAAMSAPGEGRDPSLVYTAAQAGEHLVVVANLGDMEELEYQLTYAVNGFPSSDFRLNTGVLDEVNREDAFRFDASAGTYTMVVVRLPENSPAATVTASLRWPTMDSVALSTLTLTPKARVGAFVIDGNSLPVGDLRHYVHLEASVPAGRTVSYQVQFARSGGPISGGTHNLTDEDIGALWTPTLSEGSTVDLGLRVPPGYTYSYDLGLYLFAPDSTYMSTTDPEVGPRGVSENGPGTEQEVVFTSRRTAEYAVAVLNRDVLTDLGYNLSAVVNGRPLTAPARAYVDDYNRNEHYRFTAESNTWNVIASAYVSGTGGHVLKLLTTGLSTNPVAMVGVDADDRTGVIAINGWELDTASQNMFVNVSRATGRSHFAVQAVTSPAEFGAIGHVESGQFGQNAVIYVYLVDLTVGDHLEVQLAYDKGNWSSDVNVELLVFEPVEAFSTEAVGSIGLKVTEGKTLIDGQGEFLAERTGTYAFVLVNKGALGPLGFSMGVYRRSVADQPPLYPAILKVVPSKDSLTVHWAPNQEANFDHYEIWLSDSFESKGKKVDVIADQSLSKYTITNLDPGHKYWIIVETYNTAGQSTESNPWEASTATEEVWEKPIFWIVVGVILIPIVFIVVTNTLIKKQRSARAVASETSADVAVGPTEEAGVEVETIEAERPRPRPPTAVERDERQEAIDFAKEMMGDEEG